MAPPFVLLAAPARAERMPPVGRDVVAPSIALSILGRLRPSRPRINAYARRIVGWRLS
jgi:hypothetical protein